MTFEELKSKTVSVKNIYKKTIFNFGSKDHSLHEAYETVTNKNRQHLAHFNYQKQPKKPRSLTTT